MRAHYFDLYDLAPVGLLTLSEKGATLEANFTTARLLGVKKEALLKRRLDDFVDPDDRERFARHQRLFIAGDAPPHLELRMLRGSADPFWARLDLMLGHGTDGVLMFRVMLSDITERLKMQEDLYRLRAAVDQAHDGVAVADTKGLMQFANLAWARMHGYTKEEILGKSLSFFHTAEQMTKDVVPFNTKVLAKGSHAGEVGHVRRDGTTFPSWMSTALLRDADGTITGLVGMADDITERRRAEETLARILGEREAILKAIPDAYYRLNSEMKLTDWNQAFERATGYAPDELRGMSALRFFKTDQKAIAEGIQEAVEKGHAYRAGRLLTREGREIPYVWSGAAVRTADGDLAGLVGIGRDLTAN